MYIMLKSIVVHFTAKSAVFKNKLTQYNTTF